MSYAADAYPPTALPLITAGHPPVARGGYDFRYNGLRQLHYANGRWFLLPGGWARDNGAPVIVLPDGHAGSRVDMAR